MQILEVILSLSTFIIAYYISRKIYRKYNNKHPDRKIKNLALGISYYVLSWFFLAIIAGLVIGSDGKPKPEISQTTEKKEIENVKKPDFISQLGQQKTYSILKSENKSKSPNNRVASYWILSPEAITLADRSATVRKAAEDIQEKTSIPVISVFLQPNKESVGKGYALAMAKYFSDGCQYSGTDCNDEIWAIDASKDVISPSQQKIFTEWYKNRGRFLDKEENLDEDKLTSFIAKKLKIDESAVNLPFITTEKVNPYYSEADKKSSFDKMKSQQEAIAKRAKQIESQFSSWDGSHRDLEKRIKNAMNDPDSYKHYKTVYFDRGDYLTVITEFGGKNGFGGMVRNTASADYTIDGRFIKEND
ncbi:DUF4875 domain-containing protein [Erwinia billingiae]|uniref:DUF4875 domain-containing protein n=1 Tax=Erwinia billingiae TaxID=182337 RepID=UPI001246980F|nr:DUF4875 domain-containing protein [Erwinia billingiae]QEW33217.1 DUF4875 domain-containing protein [Erwinia billingiae]